jgi:hypothetical protein
MKKTLGTAAHIVVTILIMIVTSVLIVRIVDSTVRIDDDMGILILLLAGVNIVIGAVSCRLYKAKTDPQRKKRW